MHVKVAETTNTENVCKFYQELAKSYHLRDSVIVMDNHSSHHSILVRDYLHGLNCKILYLPPATSYFNPIETYWSLMKKEWRNRLVTVEPKDVTSAWSKRTVMAICRSFKTPTLRRLYHCHFRDILRFLQELIEPEFEE